MERGDEYPVHLAEAYGDVIRVVNALERDFGAVESMAKNATAESMDGICGHRAVRFGSSPPTTPTSAVSILKKRGILTDPMEDYTGIDMGVDLDME
jgi:uncharacterized protein YutE (UPF0331/DUF86 family)